MAENAHTFVKQTKTDDNSKMSKCCRKVHSFMYAYNLLRKKKRDGQSCQSAWKKPNTDQSETLDPNVKAQITMVLILVRLYFPKG